MLYSILKYSTSVRIVYNQISDSTPLTLPVQLLFGCKMLAKCMDVYT